MQKKYFLNCFVNSFRNLHICRNKCFYNFNFKTNVKLSTVQKGNKDV